VKTQKFNTTALVKILDNVPKRSKQSEGFEILTKRDIISARDRWLLGEDVYDEIEEFNEIEEKDGILIFRTDIGTFRIDGDHVTMEKTI
jgi:hypothetical protein